MPNQIDKEALEAANRFFGNSIECGLRDSDDSDILKLAAIIQAAYAPRIAAYEHLYATIKDYCCGGRPQTDVTDAIQAIEKLEAH